MTTPNSPDAPGPAGPDDRERAARALADEFFRRQGAGETPDPFALILAHPDCAGELERLLGGAITDYLATQSRVLSEPADGEPPRVIGRYQVHKTLGAGASAVVYLAYDTKFE